MTYSSTLPSSHEKILTQIITEFSQDTRIVGIGASGSYASNSMDKYSDLDLVIAIDPLYFEAVMAERFTIIDKVGGKVAAFTGEHVGEPRLVIALYAPDTIHVDYKFVALPDAATRVDDTKVLWERDNLLSSTLATSQYQYPQPDLQWIEDRFWIWIWIWIHYAATKIARGEYFETVEFLSFMRTTVIAPLALKQQGLIPSGVRKIEQQLPAFANDLTATVAQPEKEALTIVLDKCIELYLVLRKNESVTINKAAQTLCTDYLIQELKQ